MKSHYKKESSVSLGNLYDMNKHLMEQVPMISEDILKEKKQELVKWIAKLSEQHYFMLLCHEKRDYTLFNIISSPLNDITIDQINRMAEDIVECMNNRGSLLSLELQKDGAWELWARDETGCYAYYLFPYGSAVLEYKELLV